MTITITWQMVAWLIALAVGWTGFLLGGVKWLLNKQVKSFEDRLAAAEKKAADAELKASTAITGQSKYREDVIQEIAGLRLELNTKLTCGNHQRMENNDEKMFTRLDNLHGDIRELSGGVKGLTQTLKMVQQHLMEDKK
ncbi:MAG: hypothetical protein HXX17_11905 [Geobacteraceae bacterium]|nr:hypothetical protein [Geobacteraceae bacterium]